MPSSLAPLRWTRNTLLLLALHALSCGSDTHDAQSRPAAGGSAGDSLASGDAGNAQGAAASGGSAGNTGDSGANDVPAAGAAGGEPPSPVEGGNGGSVTSGAGTAGRAGAPAVAAQDLWVAPDGEDTNPGTEARPLMNLPYALALIKPGFTIWIKAGSYEYTTTIQLKKSGTAAAPYTVSAAPGARPVINFKTPAGGRGFDIQADYWTLSGFEVANASDNCVAISGSHNVVENLSIHGCGDTGLQITVGTGQVADNTRGADNLILNTDSYENLDVATGGENADGFAAKLRIGPGNVFRGCRAFNNADDGWDFFAADDVVEIDGCWAFSNGKGVAGNNPAGDGNAFKLGGKPTSAGEGGAVHLVKNSFAFENLTCGFTRNSNPDVPELTACGAKDNATDYCQTLSRTGEVSMSMTAAAARAVKRAADGSLPPMK